MCSEVLEEAEQRGEAEEELAGFEESEKGASAEDVAVEEKRREARKPLYLKRYE